MSTANEALEPLVKCLARSSKLLMMVVATAAGAVLFSLYNLFGGTSASVGTQGMAVSVPPHIAVTVLLITSVGFGIGLLLTLQRAAKIISVVVIKSASISDPQIDKTLIKPIREILQAASVTITNPVVLRILSFVTLFFHMGAIYYLAIWLGASWWVGPLFSLLALATAAPCVFLFFYAPLGMLKPDNWDEELSDRVLAHRTLRSSLLQ